MLYVRKSCECYKSSTCALAFGICSDWCDSHICELDVILIIFQDWRHQNCREVFPGSRESRSGKRTRTNDWHRYFNEQVMQHYKDCDYFVSFRLVHIRLFIFFLLFLLRAFVYLSQNNYADAHSCFSSVLKIDPNNPVVNTADYLLLSEQTSDWYWFFFFFFFQGFTEENFCVFIVKLPHCQKRAHTVTVMWRSTLTEAALRYCVSLCSSAHPE